MNIIRLSWKNLAFKPWSTALSLILFALGVGLVALLLLLNRQIETQFERNQADIDMVLGAKGSPLQVVLSSMYHIDAPTGNISLESAAPFLNPNHPLIKKAVPLSLGDSHRGYRIVGTDTSFLSLYDAQLDNGALWQKPMEVVAGYSVAQKLGLEIGDTFNSSHGLVIDDNLVHEDASPFVVVGILQPSGTVVDQLLLCDARSIWQVHDHEDTPSTEEDPLREEEGHEHHEHDHGQDVAERPLTDYPDKDITSILVQFKNKKSIQALNFPRAINENTDLLAASPAYEINSLLSQFDWAWQTLRGLALAIVLVSAFSIFISLYNSLRDRRYELALVRVMGGSRLTLFLLILTEGLLLASLGWGLGVLLSHGGMEMVASLISERFRYSFTGLMWLPQEWWLLAGSLGIGVLASIIPAISASRTEISQTLGEG